jgi:Carboxypeptidase regulatory-like domain
MLATLVAPAFFSFTLFSWAAFPNLAFASDITGEITNAQGNPQAGVEVSCTDASGKPVGQATTNDAGRYCITGLIPGTYTCSTSPPAGAGLQAGSATLSVPDQGLTDNWSLSPGAAAAISSSSTPGVCAAGLLGGYNPYLVGFLGIGAVAGISMGICASMGCISDSSPQLPVTGTK